MTNKRKSNTAKNAGKTGKDCVTATGRVLPGALDNHYVEAYLDNPKLSQMNVLKLAMINADVEGNATRSRAHEIHDRLRDRINTEMVKLASDLKNLSISVIKDLMINSLSDSVKLSAAQTGTKDLFPNISIKKEQLTTEERRDKIAKLQKDLQSEALH